ncbi:hypothetical protein Trco_001927 [Trichoderma cornu-damae]|uniref:Arf-GAP domain-containing protein n=1 Tax=Trichoderma cornu-damae TaxID=654480 RepID=A0A9P8QNW6_9HYPO|nr:hypothetical protein Trco_001927 [Trichoderma cornu-damae]
MSRRAPNPGAERAAQNQATIKSLLKLEPNKICADCKRNKHPRWASWNLGIFICIRCSGIHRGMGTHISRVKSVDLDSWTDEQLQSVLNWGNARANKYWEFKLAPGHTPSESKIENFIRTKYELKRWTMDGPIPDPSTLEAAADDDVPLSLVKEKQVVERNESIRKASIGHAQVPRRAPLPPPAVGDLIGGDDPAPPVRANSGPPVGRVTPKAEPAPPKTTGTKDSLLGLDFLGEASAPPRPASTPGAGSAAGQSRPDLKQSILSLYASAPKPPPQQQQQQQQYQPQHGFGGPVSPTMSHHSQGSMGGFGDAFGSLSLASVAAPKPAPVDPFAGLGSRTAAALSQSNGGNAFGGLSGGGFFDQKPAQQPSHQPKPSNASSSGSGFGGFGAFSSPAAAAPKASSAMGDLFDFSTPATAFQPTSPPAAQPSAAASGSVFNLSKPAAPAPAPAPSPSPAAGALGGANLSGADVWGGNEWSSGPSTAAALAQKSPPLPKPSATSLGWEVGSFANTPIVPGSNGGFSPAPKVAADEEFGGWTSSTGPAASGTTSKGGFGGDEDLFSNVWQ